MKVRYFVALLMVLLLIGCATKTQPAAPATPTTPPPETPAAPPTPPTVPETSAPTTPTEAPKVAEGEITVTSAGFDPAETTVKVGATLSIKSTEGRHKLTVGGTTTPAIEEGSAYDVTFDKVGKIRVFDIFTKKSAYVTVIEAIEETAEGVEGAAE